MQRLGGLAMTSRTSRKTILLVEDDDDIGSFLVQALTHETPHQTLHVSDGIQALEAAGKLIPDLFIIDYLLPDMNGIELYDILQASKKLAAIPTIIISAHLPIQEIIKRKVIGFKKPFDLQKLLDAIHKMLDSSLP